MGSGSLKPHLDTERAKYTLEWDIEIEDTPTWGLVTAQKCALKAGLGAGLSRWKRSCTRQETRAISFWRLLGLMVVFMLSATTVRGGAGGARSLRTTSTRAGRSQTASSLHHEVGGEDGSGASTSIQPGPRMRRDTRKCSRELCD